MRIAILGAGSIGLGMAALLCRDGHVPVLWSPSGAGTAALSADAPLEASGVVEGRFAPAVAASCAAALAGAAAAVIAVPGYGHRAVLDAMVPHLRSGQVVIYSSHMSLGALYLARRLAIPVPIVALGTTLVTGRRTGPASVRVGSLRARLDAAVLHDLGSALELCRTLFGNRFVRRESLLAIALSNLNPQNHMAIALCNLTRMERGEMWRQNAHITPAVAALIEALDAERLAVAAAFGLRVRTIVEHFATSFHVPSGRFADMAAALAGRADDVPGPATLDTRYVTEDVPFGLVPTTRIAALAGVPVPLHEAGVGLFSALYGRDFPAENDILPALGPLTREMLEPTSP